MVRLLGVSLCVYLGVSFYVCVCLGVCVFSLVGVSVFFSLAFALCLCVCCSLCVSCIVSGVLCVGLVVLGDGTGVRWDGGASVRGRD